MTLPKEAHSRGWGNKYTFYVSGSGTAFHGSSLCHPAALIPKNAANLTGKTPCKRCNPYKPDLKWYWEYRRILKITEKYHIDVPKE
jgi:hypothetical protein